MSEEEAIEKTKRKREEDFSVGRYIGVIARKDPKLYERLKSYAETQGLKFTDIVYQALIMYDEYMSLATVDTKSLLAAIRLIDHLFKRLLDMMMALNQFFTSEFFQQQIGIIHQLQQQRQQTMQKIQEEHKKSKQQEIKAKLVEMTMNTMMSILSNIMTMITTTIAKQQGIQQPPQQNIMKQIQTKPIKIVRGSQEQKEQA